MGAQEACPTPLNPAAPARWAVFAAVALIAFLSPFLLPFFPASGSAKADPAITEITETGAKAPASTFLAATLAGHLSTRMAAAPLSFLNVVPGFAAAPATTGSFKEVPSQLRPFDAALALSPKADQVANPFVRAMLPGSATTLNPTFVAPATPQGGQPGGAPQPTNPAPAPSFAERLHTSLDAYAAAEAKAPDAAEKRKIREAIAAFYAGHNYEPLWLKDGKPNAAAKSVLDRLAHAADDGLSLDDLPSPAFADATDDEKLAEAEIALTAQVVEYGREASGSRIDPVRLSNLIGAKPEVAEPGQILGAVAAAGGNAGAALEGFNPPQPGYRALRDKLAELRREGRPEAAKPIPPGPTLRIGMSDPRVPLIRVRFGLDADPSDDSDQLYDTKVAAAVAEFQKAAGLRPSGMLTARTVAALATGDQPLQLEDVVLANMEMWRWLPRDLGKDRIEVNIPDFTVAVFRDDQLIARHRVIVGKPQTPTPIFSNAMKFVIVNPIWNVPPSIIRKEMLPRLAQDPDYLARMGFEVFSVHGHLVVRQPPGERNALGRIKFMFPNQYDVYLHDTPTRNLFAASRRAFSHGCVRVDDPFSLAETVLGPNWPEERVKHLIGGEQRFINLPKPLPIHIEYFTAFVDADGHLQMRDDLYGYARKVDAALGLTKMSTAEQ
jgi:L,D-transpeptidase YcbB